MDQAYRLLLANDWFPDVTLGVPHAVSPGSADAGLTRRQTDPGARIALAVRVVTQDLLGLGPGRWSRRWRWLALRSALGHHNVLRSAIGTNLIGGLLMLGADRLRRPISRENVRSARRGQPAAFAFANARWRQLKSPLLFSWPAPSPMVLWSLHAHLSSGGIGLALGIISGKFLDAARAGGRYLAHVRLAVGQQVVWINAGMVV